MASRTGRPNPSVMARVDESERAGKGGRGKSWSGTSPKKMRPSHWGTGTKSCRVRPTIRRSAPLSAPSYLHATHRPAYPEDSFRGSSVPMKRKYGRSLAEVTRVGRKKSAAARGMARTRSAANPKCVRISPRMASLTVRIIRARRSLTSQGVLFLHLGLHWNATLVHAMVRGREW